MREFDLIEALAARLSPRRDDTRLGIGDDGAIMAPAAGHELVVTTDTLIAGRHFPADTTPEAIGYKTAAVNLSDLAAMAAEPAWLTVSLAAPSLERAWCDRFIDGLWAAIHACPVDAPIDIVGGDTTRADCLTLSVTAIGQVRAGMAVRRTGAQPGDVIAVTGTLGDAAAGLACRGQRDREADRDWLIQRLERPDLRRGAALAGQAHAAIDISDGLLADLGHILAASGLGATVFIDDLPCSPALARVVADQRQRRRHQATGGDDYELCLCLPAGRVAPLRAALGCELTVIGEIEQARGLRLRDHLGHTVAAATLGQPGWDHFVGG